MYNAVAYNLSGGSEAVKQSRGQIDKFSALKILYTLVALADVKEIARHRCFLMKEDVNSCVLYILIAVVLGLTPTTKLAGRLIAYSLLISFSASRGAIIKLAIALSQTLGHQQTLKLFEAGTKAGRRG